MFTDLSDKLPGARKIKVSERATLSPENSQPRVRVRQARHLVGHHDHLAHFGPGCCGNTGKNLAEQVASGVKLD